MTIYHELVNIARIVLFSYFRTNKNHRQLLKALLKVRILQIRGHIVRLRESNSLVLRLYSCLLLLWCEKKRRIYPNPPPRQEARPLFFRIIVMQHHHQIGRKHFLL